MERFGIELHTIFGPRKGTLTLERQQDEVDGELELLGRRNPFHGRMLDAISMLLFGELQGLYRPLAYTMNCVVRDGSISGEMTTPICKLKLSGDRLSNERESEN